ncbi:MAG: cysteine desulfuration protein SufE [Sodalis sp. (in: enterobacteria)]
MNLPDKEKFLFNFSLCANWEEKYLYLIELGGKLLPLPVGMHTQEHLIAGCQSQVWIVLKEDTYNYVQLYGDSDSAIVKGMIATVFILYNGLSLAGILSYNVQPFFETIALSQHLTPSRALGLEAIVRSIRVKAATWHQPISS